MYLQIKRALVASLMSLTCLVAMAQKTVSGNVVDATGEPMIGVTVLADGKPVAVTDFDGNFSIPNATASTKIKISYVGYKDQEITVGNQSQINVKLEEDAQTLNEVVVVGYGTMKKSDLTGSVSSIETEQLNAKGASSPLGNLQGSVAGVNITQSSGRAGSGFDIEIRGKSSLASGTTPIFVIDGIVCDDMDFLNPQDIERIDVLKDASSTAIYGSRATAGVVMVTTKSGAGVAKKTTKPSVSYDGYYGVSKVTRLPDFMDTNDFYEWRFLKYQTYNEGSSNNAAQSGRPAYEQFNMWQHMLLWKTDADNDPYGLGGYSRLKYFRDNGYGYDWPDAVTQDGIQQNHYLAVSGSVGVNNDVNYHFGVGYNQEKGIYKGDEQRRINFKGSLDAKLYSWLTSGFNFSVARQENEQADGSGTQYAWRMNPYMRIYDDEGNVIDKPGNYLNLGSDNGNQFSDQVSPLITMFNQTYNKETWRLLGNFYVQIKPIKELSLKSTFAPTYTQYREGTFNEANDLISGYENDEEHGNRAINRTHRVFGWTWTNQVNFNKTFNDVHNIDFLALNEVISSNSEDLQVTARRVLDGSTWYGVGTAADPTTTQASSSYTENSMISYALRANYTYAGKYMATATIRWDGSSKFADGHRWGSFPSFALAWRASEENFLKNVGWLSNLKLRLSYGVTGNNSGVSNYGTQQTVSSTAHYYPFGGTHYTGLYPSGIVDALISWERSNEFNFGIDFGFLNNRINGSVDLYQKTSKDLLYDVLLPLEAGKNGSSLKEMTTNVGSVRNRGVEVNLTTVNVQTKDWNWQTTFTFAHNKNVVKEINGVDDRLIKDATSSIFVGQPFHNVYGYEWNGLVTDGNIVVPDNAASVNKGFTPGSTVKASDYYYAVYGWGEGMGIITDLNGDGEINEDDQKIFSADPTWTGSFTSNLSYKNWDFSFSLYAKQNYTVASNFLGEYLGYGDRGRMRYNMDYYIPAGTLIDFDGVRADGTYVNPVYQDQTHYGEYPFPQSATGAFEGTGSTYWASAATYVDASFVKVKNITLGYTFSRKLLEKVGVRKLRLYATVTNPFVFTNYKGFDPEWASASNRNDAPSTVTYQFGASLKF